MSKVSYHKLTSVWFFYRCRFKRHKNDTFVDVHVICKILSPKFLTFRLNLIWPSEILLMKTGTSKWKNLKCGTWDFYTYIGHMFDITNEVHDTKHVMLFVIALFIQNHWKHQSSNQLSEHWTRPIKVDLFHYVTAPSPADWPTCAGAVTQVHPLSCDWIRENDRFSVWSCFITTTLSIPSVWKALFLSGWGFF